MPAKGGESATAARTHGTRVIMGDTMDPEAIIGRIMERHGGRGSVAEFHQAVNVTFHEFESEVYDREHADMWESLPSQFALLVDDWMGSDPAVPGEIRLLDIGCGTGLATASILRTRVGTRVKSVHLVDTSPSMLRRASQRASQWNVAATYQEGLLDSVPGEGRFDMIVTCSVLHHIPHLPPFLNTVRKLQADGGVFLHLQDPNGDFRNDPVLRERMSRHSRRLCPEWARRFTPQRVLARLSRELSGKQGQDYVSKTNRTLVEKGFLETPLSVQELFEITDIHVQDGEGISIEAMKSWLPDYHCLSQRSYAFMGELWSTLPRRSRKMEEDLIAAKARNGFHTGAIWKLGTAAK
jgi:SAM-dependent methyltransferase